MTWAYCFAGLVTSLVAWQVVTVARDVNRWERMAGSRELPPAPKTPTPPTSPFRPPAEHATIVDIMTRLRAENAELRAEVHRLRLERAERGGYRGGPA